MEISGRRESTQIRWEHVCLMMITCFALWSRLHFTQIAFNHPDEPIAFGVVKGMLSRGTLDTNWAHFDLPAMFHYRQFNFSTFHVFLAAIFAPFGAPSIEDIRIVSAAFGALCVPLTYELGRRLHSLNAGLFGAALVAISPQLLLDSIFARPDSFFVVLFLCALLLIPVGTISIRRSAVSGVLFGLMVACKVSALLLFPIPVLLLWGSHGSRRMLWVFAIASAVGFVLGVPYVLLDPRSFLIGVRVLSTQYSGMPAPFGLGPAPLSARALYLLTFLSLTTSPFILAGSLAALRRSALGIITAISLLSVLYLGTRPLFGERNFDHCLPILFIAGWAGIARLTNGEDRPWVLPVLAALAAAPCAYYGFQLQHGILSGRYQGKVDAYMAAVPRDTPTWLMWPSIVYADDPVEQIREYMKGRPLPATVTFSYVDDHFEQENIQRFLSGYRYVKLSELRDPFSVVPPSSVQGYLAPSYVTYRLSAPDN